MVTRKIRPGADWLTLEESCTLLHISRPTFNKRRQEFDLKVRHWGGRLWFSKRQLADRILLKTPANISSQVALMGNANSRVTQIKRKGNVYDLRSISSIDPFGVICLLCAIISEQSKVSVIYDDSKVGRLLASIGFFSELAQKRADVAGLSRLPNFSYWLEPTIMQPLVAVTHKGAERSTVVELQKILAVQGFTPEIANYAGWLIGELADNALTHGKATCYTIVQRIGTKGKRIAIGLGDLGIGIPQTLKLNPKYSSLSDRAAFVMAFRPYVSGWGDEYKRGKGLTDIVKIVAGNRGMLRVESGSMGLEMNFRDGVDIQFTAPMTKFHGTRYSIVIEDHGFKEVSRSEADHFLQEAMLKLFADDYVSRGSRVLR
jgi:hypothetical protein